MDFKINFSEVFHAKGGFDVVIANPPYINTIQMKDNAIFYRTYFTTAYGSYDIYVLFFEKSIQILRTKGILTFITSNKFFIADYAKKIRSYIVNNSVVITLMDLADCKRVFEALVSPAITILCKQKADNYDLKLAILKDDDVFNIDNIDFERINIRNLFADIGSAFNIYIGDSNRDIFQKFSDSTEKLSNLADVRTGVMGFEYWNMAPYIIDGEKKDGFIRIIANSHIEKYTFLFGKKINLYKKSYRNPYIDINHAPLNDSTKDFFLNEKIIVRGVAKKITAQLDLDGYGLLVAVHGITKINKQIDKRYILALLNSFLFNWLHLTTFYTARIPQGSLKYPISFLKNLPIKKISLKGQKPFIDMIDKILAITKDDDYLDNSAKQAQAREYEKQIDQKVYDLYGLTEEEIRIVEGETK